MNRRIAAVWITSLALTGMAGAARGDSISGTINTEWIIATPVIDILSLPAVQSIDSITIDIAHSNGSDLAMSVDAVDVVGEADFDLMFQETAGGGPFSMGVAPANGTLANVAAYTFVPSGGGDYTAPHTPAGVLNANAWLAGPLPAQEYAVFIVDLTLIFDGGAIGTWTINYTPVPAPGAMFASALLAFTGRARRRAGASS